MSRIEKVLEEGGEEADISFTPSEIQKEWEQAKERTRSKWMIGIYGDEGTAKSGVLLDMRTEEEKKNGTKIVVIDVDNSCRPLWEDIWDCDPNIRIFNPLVKIGKGTDKRPSYIASYRKVIALLSWIEDNIHDENIGYVAIDGMDTFLKWCEFVMKDTDLGNVDIHNSDVGYDWGKRNQRYYRVLDWLKSLPVATAITAHRDAKEDFKKGKIIDRGPNWHKGTRQDTADELFQIIEMKKRVEERGDFSTSIYYGNVHKWKGDVTMEQRRFKVLESKVDKSNNKAEYEWHGLIPKIRKFLRDEEKSKETKEESSLEDILEEETETEKTIEEDIKSAEPEEIETEESVELELDETEQLDEIEEQEMISADDEQKSIQDESSDSQEIKEDLDDTKEESQEKESEDEDWFDEW